MKAAESHVSLFLSRSPGGEFPYDMKFLKEAYRTYFSRVARDKVGGRGRIKHFTACMQLVREGKLKRNRDGSFSAPHRGRP